MRHLRSKTQRLHKKPLSGARTGLSAAQPGWKSSAGQLIRPGCKPACEPDSKSYILLMSYTMLKLTSIIFMPAGIQPDLPSHDTKLRPPLLTDLVQAAHSGAGWEITITSCCAGECRFQGKLQLSCQNSLSLSRLLLSHSRVSKRAAPKVQRIHPASTVFALWGTIEGDTHAAWQK